MPLFDVKARGDMGRLGWLLTHGWIRKSATVLFGALLVASMPVNSTQESFATQPKRAYNPAIITSLMRLRDLAGHAVNNKGVQLLTLSNQNSDHDNGTSTMSCAATPDVAISHVNPTISVNMDTKYPHTGKVPFPHSYHGVVAQICLGPNASIQDYTVNVQWVWSVNIPATVDSHPCFIPDQKLGPRRYDIDSTFSFPTLGHVTAAVIIYKNAPGTTTGLCMQSRVGSRGMNKALYRDILVGTESTVTLRPSNRSAAFDAAAEKAGVKDAGHTSCLEQNGACVLCPGSVTSGTCFSILLGVSGRGRVNDPFYQFGFYSALVYRGYSYERPFNDQDQKLLGPPMLQHDVDSLADGIVSALTSGQFTQNESTNLYNMLNCHYQSGFPTFCHIVDETPPYPADYYDEPSDQERLNSALIDRIAANATAAAAFLDNLDNSHLSYPYPAFMWRIATVYVADHLQHYANLYDNVHDLTYHQRLIVDTATGTPDGYTSLTSPQDQYMPTPRDKRDIGELQHAIAIWMVTSMPHPLLACLAHCQEGDAQSIEKWAGDSGFLMKVVARGIHDNYNSAYKLRAEVTASDKDQAAFENGVLYAVIGILLGVPLLGVPDIAFTFTVGAMTNIGLSILPPVITASQATPFSSKVPLDEERVGTLALASFLTVSHSIYSTKPFTVPVVTRRRLGKPITTIVHFPRGLVTLARADPSKVIGIQEDVRYTAHCDDDWLHIAGAHGADSTLSLCKQVFSSFELGYYRGPSMQDNPSYGSAGASIHVTGQQFAPNVAVAAVFFACERSSCTHTTIGRARTRPNGTFAMCATIPHDAIASAKRQYYIAALPQGGTTTGLPQLDGLVQGVGDVLTSEIVRQIAVQPFLLIDKRTTHKPSPPRYGSESVSGGGMVNGVPFVREGVYGDAGSQQGFFVEVPAYPPSPTTLLDMNMGAPGYYRIVLEPNGHLHLQKALDGETADLDFSTKPLPLNQFVWVSAVNGENGARTSYRAEVLGQGGVALGDKTFPGTVAVGGNVLMTATVGWGVSVSSTDAGFPNVKGWALSKLDLANGNPNHALNPLPLPTADGPVPGSAVYYDCRQPLGSASQLVDASGHGRDSVAGPNRITINQDGPYIAPLSP